MDIITTESFILKMNLLEKNGTESFWSFTKHRLAQFNGLRDEMFYSHLKESEFRLKNLRENNL